MPARKSLSALALFGGVLFTTAPAPHRALPTVDPNPNVARAGVLHDGVLTVTLEAKESTWWLNGLKRPPMAIAAFSEPGKAPLIPGPLIRVPLGTDIRLSVRNSLQAPITFFVPSAVHGEPDRTGAVDSIVVAPGAVGELNERVTTAGNYVLPGHDARSCKQGARGPGPACGRVGHRHDGRTGHSARPRVRNHADARLLAYLVCRHHESQSARVSGWPFHFHNKRTLMAEH